MKLSHILSQVQFSILHYSYLNKDIHCNIIASGYIYPIHEDENTIVLKRLKRCLNIVYTINEEKNYGAEFKVNSLLVSLAMSQNSKRLYSDFSFLPLISS